MVAGIFFIFTLTGCLGENSSKEAGFSGGLSNQWIQRNECKILALWDSITAGYSLPLEESYPAQLETKIQNAGINCRVVNAGISGDTSKNLLDRLDFTLGDETYSLAIVVIGWNDWLRSLPVYEMKENISEIISQLQKRNIPILLWGMQLPQNAGLQAKAFREVYPDIAKEYKVPLLPFFLEWVAMKPELNIADRIHPNAQWYAIISENIFQFIKKQKLLK